MERKIKNNKQTLEIISTYTELYALYSHVLTNLSGKGDMKKVKFYKQI